MNKFKIISLACLLASTGYATTVPCNGFKINLKNHLAQNVVINKLTLSNASLQADGGELIPSGNKRMYTVGNSSEKLAMIGEVILSTMEEPARQVAMQFTLENKGLYCKIDEVYTQGSLSIKKTRLVGGVNYKIVEGN